MALFNSNTFLAKRFISERHSNVDGTLIRVCNSGVKNFP
jgi:hypothetical protein